MAKTNICSETDITVISFVFFKISVKYILPRLSEKILQKVILRL